MDMCYQHAPNCAHVDLWKDNSVCIISIIYYVNKGGGG